MAAPVLLGCIFSVWNESVSNEHKGEPRSRPGVAQNDVRPKVPAMSNASFLSPEKGSDPLLVDSHVIETSAKLSADERLVSSLDCIPVGRILAQQGQIPVSETATDDEIATATWEFFYGRAVRSLRAQLRNRGLHDNEIKDAISGILDTVVRRFPSQAKNYGQNIFGFMQQVASDKANAILKGRRVEYEGDLTRYVAPLKYGAKRRKRRENFFDPHDPPDIRAQKKEIAQFYLKAREECARCDPTTIEILDLYGPEGTRENDRRRFELAEQLGIAPAALRQRVHRAREKLYEFMAKKCRIQGYTEDLAKGLEHFDLDELKENVT